MRESLPQHTVVLLGAGHTNSHVIRMWRMQPLCDVQLICVSDFGMATYSGMLPGTLAGQYDLVEMQIDLVRLCAAAGVRLLRAEVTGLDADNCELLYMRSVPVPEEEEAEEEGESPAVYISRNETMQSIMRAAAELHGALEEGVFNAACFAHAWSDWMGGETLDGATVRAILSKRDDVSELPNHRDHYLILRTANRPG